MFIGAYDPATQKWSWDITTYDPLTDTPDISFGFGSEWLRKELAYDDSQAKRTIFAPLNYKYAALGEMYGVAKALKLRLMQQLLTLDPISQSAELNSLNNQINKINNNLGSIESTLTWNPNNVASSIFNGYIPDSNRLIELKTALEILKKIDPTYFASTIEYWTKALAKVTGQVETAATISEQALMNLMATLKQLKQAIATERELLTKELAELDRLRQQAQALGLI